MNFVLKRFHWIALPVIAFAMTFVAVAPAAAQSQTPSFRGSITVPGMNSEGAEISVYLAMAKTSVSQALQAVAGSYPNASISGVRLENQNGSLVYAVDVNDPSKGYFQVFVDAGNAKILGTDMGSQNARYGNDTRYGHDTQYGNDRSDSESSHDRADSESGRSGESNR